MLPNLEMINVNELIPQTTALPPKLEPLTKIIADVKRGAYMASLNILVIKKMLDTVHQEGRINRTNLAGKTGLNYVSCSRYVNTLVLFDWLRILSDYKHVAITERGIDMKRILEILNDK